MPFTDDQIRGAVINLFKKYDKDNSGFVEGNEAPNMCNDLAKELGSSKNYSKEQIDAIHKTIDRNMDGRITKDELYVLMRRLNP